eukprot:295686-Rhodomonas_salina.1
MLVLLTISLPTSCGLPGERGPVARTQRQHSDAIVPKVRHEDGGPSLPDAITQVAVSTTAATTEPSDSERLFNTHLPEMPPSRWETRTRHRYLGLPWRGSLQHQQASQWFPRR